MATSVFDMPKLPERELLRWPAAGKARRPASRNMPGPATPVASSSSSWSEPPQRFHFWTLLAVAALHIGGFAAAVSYNYYTAPQTAPEDSFVRVLPMDAPPPPKEQQLVPVFSDVPLPVVTPPTLTVTQPVIVSARTSPIPPAAAPVPVAPPAPAASAPSAATGPAPTAAPVTSNALSQSVVDGAPPTYPLESRRRKEQGTVVLFVKVGKNGRVLDVEVRNSSGYRRLDVAAAGAVRKWRWQPFLRGGNPVEVSGIVEIPFILSGKAA